MKKEPIPTRRPQRTSNFLPQPPSLAKQLSLQPDPKRHLQRPRATTALHSQAEHSPCHLPRRFSQPVEKQGDPGDVPTGGGLQEEQLAPSQARSTGLGLCLVLLLKHSRLCQFGLQHKYCATADSLVPIMVILQVTMRKIFLIVSGHILLPLICDLDEEKLS